MKKEKIKIGDVMFRHSTKYGDSNHHYGKVFEVVGFTNDNGSVKEQDGVSHLLTSVRLATKEEIDLEIINRQNDYTEIEI
jgi:hypothetical protein